MAWLRRHLRAFIVLWLVGQAAGVSAFSVADCCAGHRATNAAAKANAASCHGRDRAVAGLMAGKLFTMMALVGIACAAYLLAYRAARFRLACLGQGFFWVAAVMLALVLAGEFGVRMIMEGLRAQALPKEVMESVLRDRFMTWHGVASALYVVQSLLGVVLAVLHGKGR